jgi:HAD superfamily hydrolase (TIGR01490 family)
VGTSVESAGATAAAFFDLDKTIISRSSTLAFVPSFYQHGLITRSEAVRGACAQLIFRLGGAGPAKMERIRDQIGELCRGWPADQVSEIVSSHLAATIIPYIYPQARDLLAAHACAGHDIIIVSSSGAELVGPIGAMLGAREVIATQMEIAHGQYTGTMNFYAYGEAKAVRMQELAALGRYRLADCFAYSDSVTDVPMLESVGHPHAVNPDRALRKVARERDWPVLTFSGGSTDSPLDLPTEVAATSAATSANRAGRGIRRKMNVRLQACDGGHQSTSRIDQGEPLSKTADPT